VELWEKYTGAEEYQRKSAESAGVFLSDLADKRRRRAAFQFLLTIRVPVPKPIKSAFCDISHQANRGALFPFRELRWILK
jgi:hypothetical protein